MAEEYALPFLESMQDGGLLKPAFLHFRLFGNNMFQLIVFRTYNK